MSLSLKTKAPHERRHKKNPAVILSEADIQALLQSIVEGMLDKKAENIVSLDLRNLPEAIADYFVICEATSHPQVRAIADSVVDNVRKKTNQKELHVEGYQVLEWVLVDYFDIVVHVFLKDRREFYEIEQLWADAQKITEYFEDGTSKTTENTLKGKK